MSSTLAKLGLVISLMAVVASGCSSARRESSREPELAGQYDWVLAYYMSYDNDLATNTPIVLDAMEKGVKDSRTAITVLSDDLDTNGLTRLAITFDGRKSERLATDNSASVATFGKYLTWVAWTYPARHYAVVCLDHGGRLNEMCLDDHPGPAEPPSWLNAEAAGEAVRKFRREAPGEVELLFLQQCGRGSVQNLYNFRDAARFVMASQLGVGTPNSYYEPVFKWLGLPSDITGRELARRIMDTDEHFNNYVCVDGHSLGELPSRLASVGDALWAGGTASIEPPGATIVCFQCGGENNYDLLNWLRGAFRDNRRPKAALEAFESWMRDKLVLEYAVQEKQRKELAPLCGLSFFVGDSPTNSGAYPTHPLHAAGHWLDIWRTMYPAGIPTR